MFETVVILIVGVVLFYICIIWLIVWLCYIIDILCSCNEKSTSITWTGEICSTLSIETMREFFHVFFCKQRSCNFVSQTRYQQVFVRGNPAITSIPASRGVHWHEIPIKITVDYSIEVDGQLKVNILFAAPSEMEFDQPGADFFRTQAEEEHNLAFQFLETLLENIDRNASSTADDEEDEMPANDQVVPEAAATDYELLGLRVGATWNQVQTAYREACKKYHPDILSGQKLPPHLIELAAEKFKEITDAYQRLKQKFG